MFSMGTTGFRAAVPTFLHPFLSSALRASSCHWAMFVSPEYPHVYPRVLILSVTGSWFVAPTGPSPPSCSLLASAHLSVFNISLGRGLRSQSHFFPPT